MKTRLFIILLALVGCMACKKETPVENPLPETPIDGQPGPAGGMTIVKFADQSQLDYVIAQHPIKKYNSLYDNSAIYFTDTVLTLNRPVDGHIVNGNILRQDELLSWHSYDSAFAEFLDNELSIPKISPYVPLTDGYWLIDWRWIEFLPITALTYYNVENKLVSHIQEHTFLTDTKWNELESLDQYWGREKYTNPINIAEMYRIYYEEIDKFLNQYDPHKYFPQLTHYYYFSSYADEAYAFYLKDKGKADGMEVVNIPWNYEQYLSFRDSLQGAYRHNLIEIIQNNQLKELSYEYKFD